MANSYFQFKQFTVYQQHAGMKVTTDACLFGALTAEYFAAKLANNTTQISTVLDIGAGTGLLSLMVAQKTASFIDAIEIEASACLDAQQNFASSPFSEKIKLWHADIKEFSFDKKFDFIISNPPFYELDLLSPDKKINAARHDESLTLAVLINKVKSLLTEAGSFAVLLPYNRSNYFIQQSLEADLHLSLQYSIRPTPKHDFFRSMLFFERVQKVSKQIALNIKQDNNDYTAAFIDALKDYYLYL